MVTYFYTQWNVKMHHSTLKMDTFNRFLDIEITGSIYSRAKHISCNKTFPVMSHDLRNLSFNHSLRENTTSSHLQKICFRIFRDIEFGCLLLIQ